MRGTRLALTLVCLLCAPYAAQSADLGTLSPGFNLGIAYTPDDHLTGIGWNLEGSVEGLVGKVCELRGRVGVLGLEGDSHGEQAKAIYSYLTGDVLIADLISPTGGIGLYYVDLQGPVVNDDQSGFEVGMNVGVRILIPYRHERGFTIDLTAHHVFGDGPELLITLGAGMVF